MLFILYGLSPLLNVGQAVMRIDPVTGSMQRETIWLFGITSGPKVEVSPLETHLPKIGVRRTPRWQYLSSTKFDLFRRRNARACAMAPPIYYLREMLDDFIAASSDDELRTFVHVMETGTATEQKAAVDAASEKALQYTPAH
ncbi:MAG: hypothetical protein K8S99_04485 [Planctomycetes bacterium]|nr:hypothetical protein [Planctomycetota bacterium]